MSTTVETPAKFVPQYGMAFGQAGTPAIAVDPAHPLPVQFVQTGTGAAAVEGSTAAALLAGPFAPVLGREIRLALSGTWAGSAQLLRSVDGGATKLPLTIGGSAWATFQANCNEVVAEETEAGATYYLQLTPASGTIAYRVSQ